MPRNRAAAVVIYDNNLLVMYRKRDNKEYFVFPGGGIEPDETLEQAVVREIDEETSIKIKVKRQIYEFIHDNGDIHYYFLCDYIKGIPELRQNTNEYRESLQGINFYKPVWLPLSDIQNTTLYPDDAKNALLSDLKNGFVTNNKVFNIP